MSNVPTGEPVANPGPKPKRNEFLKNKAKQAIDPKASPIPLSKFFGGFHSTHHGNIEVTLSTQIPEHYCYNFIQNLRGVKNLNFLFQDSGRPELTYATSLCVGLNLAIALKLMSAMPVSEIANVSDLHLLNQLSVRVPTSYQQILSLIGKTDYYDAAIRVKESPYYVRLHILKAIWLAIKTQSFQNSPGYYVAHLNDLLGIQQLTINDLENVIFDDISTVRVLKERGRKYLIEALLSHHDIQINGETYRVSPPHISPNATKTQLIEWMNKLPPFVDAENLSILALVCIFDVSWLRRLTTPLSVIDTAFQGSVAADCTPQQFIQSCGVKYYKEYFPNDADFLSSALQVISWYNAETRALETACKFSDTSHATYGHAAQLIVVPKEETEVSQHPLSYASWKIREMDDSGLDQFLRIRRPKETASVITCARKLNTPGEIMTAASMLITTKVEYKECYRGFFTKTMNAMNYELVRKAFE